MPRRLPRETIDDIVAELRIGYSGDDVDLYFQQLADRIAAAHAEGVLRAMNELMGKNA